MRTLILFGGIGFLVGCGSNGTGTGTTCGTGTTEVNGVCTSTGGGGDTCGTGTHMDGTTCVPDAPAASGAPTVTAIDPPDAGITGNVLFTITGTNLAGADVTGLHVFFGDVTNPACEAQVGTATATTIAGEIPGSCDFNFNPVVTVTTSLGMATVPFHYDALFAADGDGGGSFGKGGDLYVIDPFAQLSFDLGPMLDAANNAYGLTGLALDATTIYGVTTGDSPADVNAVSQLVTIDKATGVVTAIGDTVNGATSYFVWDIKLVGTTLYGWAWSSAGKQLPVTISTTDGTVTPLGTGVNIVYQYGGAVSADSAGVVSVALSGAGPDTVAGGGVTASGHFDTVNTTTGGLTVAATLDYPIGAPVNAMEYIGTNLVAAIDNGTYGTAIAASGTVPTLFGVTLAVIDPAATTTPIVSPQFELPAQLGAQSHIDALGVPPVGFSLARSLPRAGWQHLAPAGAVSAH